jgi:hypothetical protein
MNIQEFAKMLDSREYCNEMTKNEEKQAKELGFVVVFGFSDDNTELQGAIDDEVGGYGNHTIYFNEKGLLQNECDDNCPYFERMKQQSKTIEAVWGEEDYSWVYKTDIPHETFDVLKDGKKYCRGIVFRMEDLKQ